MKIEIKILLIYLFLLVFVVIFMLFSINIKNILSNEVIMTIQYVSDTRFKNITIVHLNIKSISGIDTICLLNAETESQNGSKLYFSENKTISKGVNRFLMNLSGLDGMNDIRLFYNCSIEDK